MSREILFKGQRTDNDEIIEGFYLETFTSIPFIIAIYDHILGSTEMYEVKKESVVQYIGRQDIKGNKIFHKDKLKHTDGTECYVSWSDKYCQFCLCKPHTNILIQKYDSPWVATCIEEFEIIEEFSVDK